MTHHTARHRDYWKRLSHAIFAGVIVFASVNVDAQALYGSLVGNVVDETGAVVPGATVTITQRETNQTREQSTPENGAYSFPNLAPGTYDVVVTLTGFRSFSTVPTVASRHRSASMRACSGSLKNRCCDGLAAILHADSAAFASVDNEPTLSNLPSTPHSRLLR